MKEEKDAYVFDIGNKKNVIKFALAAGREDYLSDYLVLTGFWPENLIIQEKVEDCFQLDKIDALAIYLCRYRDALIKGILSDQWQEQNPDGDAAAFQVEAAEKFPMIKLMMTINRDIQFILKDILKSNTYQRDIKKYLNCMIYPVSNSDQWWFNGYESYYGDN